MSRGEGQDPRAGCLSSLDPEQKDLLWFLGYRSENDVAAAVFPGAFGPEVYRRNNRSREVEAILQLSRRQIYGIIISAFDHQTAGTPNPVIYWQTRIATSAPGKKMGDTLPTMMSIAAENIDRETTAPVLTRAEDFLGGRVDPGEIEVVEVIEGEFPEQSAPRWGTFPVSKSFLTFR